MSVDKAGNDEPVGGKRASIEIAGLIAHVEELRPRRRSVHRVRRRHSLRAACRRRAPARSAPARLSHANAVLNHRGGEVAAELPAELTGRVHLQRDKICGTTDAERPGLDTQRVRRRARDGV